MKQRAETILLPVKGDEEGRYITTEVPRVVFQEIPADTARQLMDFADQRNVGKSISVAGEVYTLDFISVGKSKFFQSRGMSVYFRVARSVVRISDHWSETRNHDRSRKLNCGRIGEAYWVLENKGRTIIESSYRAGKFPWQLKSGRAGLAVLNRSVDHWV